MTWWLQWWLVWLQKGDICDINVQFVLHLPPRGNELPATKTDRNTAVMRLDQWRPGFPRVEDAFWLIDSDEETISLSFRDPESLVEYGFPGVALVKDGMTLQLKDVTDRHISFYVPEKSGGVEGCALEFREQL
jgi:hypothetical protein